MISQDKFVKNINIMHFCLVFVSEEKALSIFNGILAYFPNKKEELEHWCFKINFGKCGDEYESAEEFYKRLVE